MGHEQRKDCMLNQKEGREGQAYSLHNNAFQELPMMDGGWQMAHDGA